jgi:hypothetical protein
LTAGVIKYYSDSFRLEHAAGLFARMTEQEPEVAALLAQSYIGMSELVIVRCLSVLTVKTRKSRPCR